MKDTIIRVHLTLLDFDPPIWRRIEVPVDFTLKRLHDVIQRVMGWQDYHLHHFEIGGVLYGERVAEDAFEDREIVSESRTKLAMLIEEGDRTFDYAYDYGDGWHLAVVLESFAAAHPDAIYPRLVDGARAGAPEDVGGPWGYAELLEAIADPNHERHEELTEWIGEVFDPERLDKGAINTALAKLAPSKSLRRRSIAVKPSSQTN
jgi:hypothetical protein